MSERPLSTLYQDLGNLVADILSHPRCPVPVFNHLSEITLNIDNATDGKPREAAHARYLVPQCLSILGGEDPEQAEAIANMRRHNDSLPKFWPQRCAVQYPPKVEAERHNYERLAKALITIDDLEGFAGPDVLDLKGFDRDDKHHLANARDGHLYALWQNLDWCDARTIEHFYVEMRLWAELRRVEIHAGYLEHQREEAERKAAAQNAPRDISALYGELGKLMGEVAEHPQCGASVSDALSEAYMVLRNTHGADIPTNLKTEFAQLAMAATAAERGQE